MTLKLYVFICLIFTLNLANTQKAYSANITDPEQCLVIGTPENLPIFDPFNRVIERMYADAGYCATFEKLNNDRSLHLLRKGGLDGDSLRVGAVIEHEKNIIAVPTVFATIEGHFVGSKDLAMRIKKFEDLKPYKIAYTMGQKWVENAVEKYGLTALAVRDPIQTYEMLRLGRVDGILTNNYFFYHDRANLGKEHDLYWLSTPLVRFNTYHVLHKEKHQDIIPTLDRSLQKIIASGFSGGDMFFNVQLEDMQLRLNYLTAINDITMPAQKIAELHDVTKMIFDSIGLPISYLKGIDQETNFEEKTFALQQSVSDFIIAPSGHFTELITADEVIEIPLPSLSHQLWSIYINHNYRSFVNDIQWAISELDGVNVFIDHP